MYAFYSKDLSSPDSDHEKNLHQADMHKLDCKSLKLNKLRIGPFRADSIVFTFQRPCAVKERPLRFFLQPAQGVSAPILLHAESLQLGASLVGRLCPSL